jgi:hypothetical protein
VALVVAAIVAAFVILLPLKQVSGYRFCVLCVSISGVWLTLLTLHWLEIFDNPVLLALLMGQTVVGLNYLVERRISEDLLIFRLPFVLTLTVLFYFAITLDPTVATAGLAVAATWIAALLLYARRDAGKLKGIARQIIECCKDW